MSGLEAALAEHLLKISVVERIPQITCHCLHDEPCLEMPPLEIVLRLALQLLRNGIQKHVYSPLHRGRNFPRLGEQLVNQEKLRQAQENTCNSAAFHKWQ